MPVIDSGTNRKGVPWFVMNFNASSGPGALERKVERRAELQELLPEQLWDNLESIPEELHDEFLRLLGLRPDMAVRDATVTLPSGESYPVSFLSVRLTRVDAWWVPDGILKPRTPPNEA